MARRIAFLTNPTSGKGRGARHAAVALPRLRAAGFAVEDLVGRDADEARVLAHRAVADGVEALVVCGGDGLVHLGAQAVASTGTALGIVPAGTGNDVARYLDIPRRDPAAAADVVVASRRRTLDLARSGDRYFVTVLAAGFDAVVNERANRMTWPRGQMRYNLATLAELRVFEPIPYTLELDGATRRLEAMLVAVGNGPSFGGGMRIVPHADVSDGVLDVFIVHPLSRIGLLAVFPRVFAGEHVDHPAVEFAQARRIRIEADDIVAYADGERIGALPVEVEVVPGALAVFA